MALDRASWYLSRAPVGGQEHSPMTDRAYAMSVPADARYLKVVRSFFKPVLEDHFGEQAGRILLALDESCSNIVKHGDGGHEPRLIQVRIEVSDHCLRIRLGDFCGKEDLPNIKPRDLEDLRAGGLGTHFVAQVMDRVTYVPEVDQPGRFALVLEKSLPGESK
jgi:sigma-B regulation protein RsbU (phosphoserine phosphatase)